MASKKKLTAKQALFVKEYLIDLNATQAAIRAGYSKRSAQIIGFENLTKPMVAEAIEAGANKRIERCDIDADYVLKQSVKLHERCMQEEQVIDRKGNATGEYKFEHTGAAKALDLIGKHIHVQAFKENINLTKDMKDLSDEDLQAIIDGRSK